MKRVAFFSASTERFYDQFRHKAVTFLDEDNKILTKDIEAAYEFLKGCRLASSKDGNGKRTVEFREVDCLGSWR